MTVIARSLKNIGDRSFVEKLESGKYMAVAFVGNKEYSKLFKSEKAAEKKARSYSKLF